MANRPSRPDTALSSGSEILALAYIVGGVSLADYDRYQARLYGDPEENRRKSIEDVAGLGREMTRRGWARST